MILCRIVNDYFNQCPMLGSACSEEYVLNQDSNHIEINVTIGHVKGVFAYLLSKHILFFLICTAVLINKWY